MPVNALQEEGFIGRRDVLQGLYRRVREAERGAAQSLVLSGVGGVGKTELLKQFFTHLFWKQDSVAPFYYSVNNAILTVPHFARDYLARFLSQRLAFDGKEQSLLNLEGATIQDLETWTRDHGVTWAADLLERFRRCADDPVDMFRIALHAPLQSSLVTGKPIVVMIDDFHKLVKLHHNERTDPTLVALFESPIASRRVPHIITGSSFALQEMLIPGVTWVPLAALHPNEAERLFQAVLQTRDIRIDTLPQSLIDHLGGNPLYICCIAGALVSGNLREEDYWASYVQEVAEGGIYHYLVTILKACIAESGGRDQVLEVLHRVYESEETAGEDRTAKGISSGKLKKEMARALLHGGFVRGEFGGIRALDDQVMRDFISFLYEREILDRSLSDIRKRFLEQRLPSHRAGVLFELTLPLMPQAELVVAQTLDQVGKNLNLPMEMVGQLQMAAIEACINAIEHNRGGERRMYISICADAGQLEVAVESPGREFIQAETGEPFIGAALREGSQRGKGIKLMKRFADSVRYEKTSRGTKVVLLKRLPRPAEMKKEGVSNRE
jgi:anti-sigma regulatory factor (Ser/Thr protein kinase)